MYAARHAVKPPHQLPLHARPVAIPMEHAMEVEAAGEFAKNTGISRRPSFQGALPSLKMMAHGMAAPNC